MNRILPVVAVVAAFFLGGCTYSLHPSVTTISFAPEKMEVIGPASAEVRKTYLLGIFPTDMLSSSSNGSESVLDAMKVARESVGADFLINVVVEKQDELYFGFLIWDRIVRVEGIGVKWKPSSCIQKQPQ